MRRSTGHGRRHTSSIPRPSASGVLAKRKSKSIINADSLTMSVVDEIPIQLDPTPLPPPKKESVSSLQIYKTSDHRDIWIDADFYINSLGFILDITKFVKFPYYIAKHGAVFLIPYIFIHITCIVPSLLKEAIIGQYTRESTIAFWKICPLFKGLGWSMLLVNFLTVLYNNTLLTWLFAYMYEILRASLKGIEQSWFSCDHAYVSNKCMRADANARTQASLNDSNHEYFWRFHLNQGNGTYGINNFGSASTMTSLILVFVHLITFVMVGMGLKWIKRYTLLSFIMASSITSLLFFHFIAFPGASSGIKYYFGIKDISNLGNLEIWTDASFYAIYASGIGTGIHLTHASFNPFKTNVMGPILSTCGMELIYSLVSAIIVFSLLGYSAYEYQTPLKKMFSIERDMFFISIPITLPNTLNISSSILLFFLFFVPGTCGYANGIMRMGNVICVLEDIFQNIFKRKYSNLVAVAILFSLSLALTFPMILKGGNHWLVVQHKNIVGVGLFFVLALQSIALGLIYGGKELSNCNFAMTGSDVHFIFIIVWRYLTPVVTFGMFILMLIRSITQVLYHNDILPNWIRSLGCTTVLILLVIIIGFGIEAAWKVRRLGLKIRLLLLISPEYEHAKILSSEGGDRALMKHYISLRDLVPLSERKSNKVEPLPLQPIIIRLPKESDMNLNESSTNLNAEANDGGEKMKKISFLKVNEPNKIERKPSTDALLINKAANLFSQPKKVSIKSGGALPRSSITPANKQNNLLPSKGATPGPSVLKSPTDNSGISKNGPGNSEVPKLVQQNQATPESKEGPSSMMSYLFSK